MGDSLAVTEDQDREAIKRIATDFIEARNRGDFRKAASWFAVEAEFTNVKGRTTVGREAIEAGFKTFYASPFAQKSPQVIETTSITFIQPSIASFDVRWRTEGAVDMNGRQRRGMWTAIVTKEPSEGWRFKVVHNIELIEGDTSKISDTPKIKHP